MQFHDYTESVSIRFVSDKVNNYGNMLNLLKTSLNLFLTVLMLYSFVYKLVRNKISD